MRQGQKGFTLVEVLLAVAIVGAIVTTVGMATTTLMLNSERPTSQHTLLQEVQNAGYWISRDIHMSRVVTPGGSNDLFLTLDIPVDDDPNHDYRIDYYLFDGGKLERWLYDSSDNLTAKTLIAQHVDTSNTTFNSDNVTPNLYRLTIRASIGEEAVTTIYEARQRLISS